MRVFICKLNKGQIVVSFLLVILLATWMLGGLKTFEEVVINVTTAKRLLPIYRVGTEENKIAISFDATWGTNLTDEILEILDEYDVTSTFFLAGYWVDKHPQYVIKIADEGHEIGNHSYSHPHMNSLSFDGIVKELEKNHAMIVDLTNQHPFLFRPPFGEYNNTVIEAADSIGYYTIQWSIDSLDWKNTTSNDIYNRIINKFAPGEIILFHNAAKETPNALRRLIPELQDQGYQIVPISELIYKDNYFLEHDGTQRLKEGGVTTL